MAEYNSFTYDEIKSSDFGVYIGGEKTFDAPSLRGQSIEIPGRNGNVFISSDSYENVELVYPSFNFEPDLETFRSKLAKLRNALSSRASYKRLTDTLHPDEFRMAVFRDGFEVKPIKYNTAAEFDIVFDCKPQRFLKSGEIPVEYTPGQTPSDEQTKTGSIVTFEAEEGTIISDIKADINPVQDLHGYDKPWAGGNGKNKFGVTLSTLKSINTFGSWSGDVYTYNGVVFTFQVDSNGYVNSIIANGTSTGNADLLVMLASGEPSYNGMILSGCPANGSSNTYSVGYSLRLSPYTLFALDNGNGATIDTQSASGQYFMYCRIRNGYTANNLVFRPMIRLASESDASFAPYSNICPISGRTSVDTTVSPTTSATDGRTYTTALGRTVYGGTPDVVSGVLTVDRAVVIYNGSENWIDHTDSKRWYLGQTPSGWSWAKRESSICNIASYYNTHATSPSEVYGPYFCFGGSGIYFNKSSASQTLADFKSQLADTNVQIVYELATPITVQLTPTEVKALLGVNNVWADSGDITVKYGTSPYIIVNPTDFPSKPLLEVTGVGSFWLGDTQITITGTSGQTVYIDCETGECYKVTGGIISPANGLVTLNRLDFPKLDSGINNIQLGAGISKVKITPRWWRL